MKSKLSLSVVLAAPRAVGVLLPNCQEAAPQQKTLIGVRTASIGVPGTPWGIVYASQKDRAFVSLTGVSLNGTGEFGNGTVGVLDTSTFPPSLIHQIPLPKAFQPVPGAGNQELELSPDGCRLFVAANDGAIVLDTALAAAGNLSSAVIGTLNGTTATQHPGYEAIQVLISPDNKYAIISQEYGAGSALIGNLDVFKLHDPSTNGSIGTPIGFLNLGSLVVGTAVSPNGRTLYATSEGYNVSGLRDSKNASCSRMKPGFFSAVDLQQLVTSPGTARHYTIPSGYAPVRVMASSDGKVVWVTSRESNALIAYDAKKLDSNSSSTDGTAALLATVQVGTSPIDLAFARNETRIITTDSNRWLYPGAVTGLSVVDVEAALAGRAGNSSGVLGRIPTGTFPRGLALSPDGKTMLVTLYEGGQIQAIDVDTLP
jgi:DNA-binding beta-propeller fold protein YncE